MIEIVVQSKFNGPSLIDIEPVLDLIQGTIDLRWTNTRAEQVVLERHHDRNFKLYVEDLPLMERTANSLGLKYVLDLGMSETAKAALLYQKTANWRAFTEGVGLLVARSLITKLSADVVRKGGRPRLAAIATECILGSISPCDADVLLRLSAMRGD
jgi:hypothetical protein